MSSKIEFLEKYCVEWVRCRVLDGHKPEFKWTRELWNRGRINQLFRALPRETYPEQEASQYLGEDIESSYNNWERAVVHLQRLEAVLNGKAVVVADPGVNAFGERTRQHFVWTIEEGR